MPQDTLSRSETIELAFEHEVRLIRDDSSDDYHRFRYEAPLSQTLYWDVAEEKNARMFTHLQAYLGGFDMEKVGKKGIPLTVARAGQDAIIAFLYADPNKTESPRHIARRFDIEKQTVYQYLSRVRDKAPDPLIDEHADR